jgi:hypothetical protein
MNIIFKITVIILILLFIINFRQKSISIINLVLYSNNNEYDEMYKLTRKFYKKFKNVITIYYKFNENNKEEYELNDDILNIKGKETFIPGILDKTIKAFKYIYNNYKFDYIVRSNISTIINFDLLTNYLENNKFDYGGGLKMIVHSIEKTYGVVDKTYFGKEYASGTSIIVSKEMTGKIINNQNKINYTVIDDVAFGILINENKKFIPKDFFMMVSNYNNQNDLINEIKNKNYIFYRNRQNDRKKDLIQIKTIIDCIN